MSLTDAQRTAIHDLVLKQARPLLTKDARLELQRVYGLEDDGRLKSADQLPDVQEDAETAETYRRLAQFLDDEARAGLTKPEAFERLVKEIAFTHLNRLVAFKMMEARKLIRGTLDKGLNSNAFKIYLVEQESAAVGDDAAYRRFLLWQSGQVAQEMAVLFDPDTLASRLFPTSFVLNQLIEWLNHSEMSACWLADETIGWVYQFFNDQEKKDVFEGLKNKRKIRRQDIPAATQLFTPNWIVRFLVQNTLGRTWVQMHPDSRLLGADLLDYLVPLQGDVPREPLRPVREITLLDPACGTMHFGLVAFDLFAAMYQEEIDRAGEVGWLETPSLSDPAEIASSIVAHNLYGIDIDLRAVQLSALALYLKAKALNKNARITDSHLACADVLPLNGARLGTFLREMQFSRLTERLIKTLWDRLKDVNQFGSLLRLEQEIEGLLHGRGAETPMLARMEAGFGGDLSDEDFWAVIYSQIVNGLNDFVKRQSEAGADMRFFTGEAVKGLRLLDVLLRRYDVVVANPPYSGKRNLNDTLATFLDQQYPDSKGDLYAAFIERCAELLEAGGRVGMLTIHSFMFLSSYETMRKTLTDEMTIEVINHMGTRTFMDLSNPNAQGFVGFTLRAVAPTADTVTNAIRLASALAGDGKREGLERALATGNDVYHVAQRKFGVVPGSPWAYWVSDQIRELFELPLLDVISPPRQGLATADNFRFLRFWWEVGKSNVASSFRDAEEASLSGATWIPYMKGGDYRRWYGNQDNVINWNRDGKQIKSFERAVVRNEGFYFKPGITYSFMTSATFNARISPGGFIFDVAGSSLFPHDLPLLLAIFNSELVNYLLRLINPTVNFQVGDLARLPIPNGEHARLIALVTKAVRLAKVSGHEIESTPDFTAPFVWHIADIFTSRTLIVDLEKQINDEIYKLYGIGDEDRAAIEAELTGGSFAAEDEEALLSLRGGAGGEVDDEVAPEAPPNREALAVRWISYAVGVALGRFQPGSDGALGRAVYLREDFAVGSLPAPDVAEFDLLVGTPERFPYVDSSGGRHFFPAEVESSLRALAVPDGISVLDEGHPRDLPALVEQALALMLGDAAAQEVIREGAAGELRRFLSRDFFTDWHFKWYRKRPVYWPLQSARRSYGFVLFHERLEKYTLYSLLRDYLDYRLTRLGNNIGDLEARRFELSGRALKALEGEIDGLAREVDELNEFSKMIERIANDGYQPEPNWIDDGVILRLAPLWELLPIWKAEPKKHWEKLAAGDFDWSHIAMHYWPDRVRAKCRTSKSFAIAHGHEEWFEA